MHEWGKQRQAKMVDSQIKLPVKHILPKANEIAKTAEQNIKSIYPFDMVSGVPAKDNSQDCLMFDQFNKNSIKFRFTPSKKYISQYFVRKNIVYDKFNNNSGDCLNTYNIFSIDKLKSLRSNDFILNIDKVSAFSVPHLLEFDSRFESANLSIVSYTDDIYCMLLHNDVNTSGYTNWFYFCATSKANFKGKIAIMNYGKAGWPFNQYLGICAYRIDTGVWTRVGSNINCEANYNLFQGSHELNHFNTLYFEYDFRVDEKVYFAYNIPYTYTDLLKELDSIEEKKLTIFHRKLAGSSLIGNRLELITITNFVKIKKEDCGLPVIFMLARTHAGETVSSWIMHYIIRFLLSNHQQAVNLRDNFIFKIFPMVNPDGVIHGNYRCSLIGRDLNRRWKNTSKQLYPEVYYIKNQIIDTFEKKQIKMVLDLHGHTQKRKCFFYGCSDKNNPHKSRLFPYLSSKFSSHIQFSSCNFVMEKSKQSTARITLYNLIKSPEIFTIQTSQFGMAQKFLSSKIFAEIAQSLCKSICKYFKLTKSSQKNNEIEDFERQMLTDPQLMKVGCEVSDGSDSDPSVSNINFEKLNKMSNRQDIKIIETISPKKKSLRPQSYKRPIPIKNNPIDYSYSAAKSKDMQQKSQISFSVPFRAVMTSGSERNNNKIKNKSPKLQLSKEMNSHIKLKQLTVQIQKKQTLLIDQKKRKGSYIKQPYFESLQFRLNHSNYHMLQKRSMLRNRSCNWNKNSV